MACNFPITIKRGSEILPKKELVPCGKCISCIERKRADWSFRLKQEHQISIKSTFLTLTYNEKFVPKKKDKLVLDKKQIQKYIKRVRHKNPGIKYYLVGEYGDKNNRPHYHAIVFNVDNSSLVDEWKDTDSGNSETLGNVQTDTVSEASIHYVTGYITSKYGKIDEKTGKAITTWSEDDIRPFALMSKSLGKIYLKNAARYHKDNFTTTTISEGGRMGLLPRYYRDRIFSEDDRKILREQNQQQFVEKFESTGIRNTRKYQIEKVKHFKKSKNL